MNRGRSVRSICSSPGGGTIKASEQTTAIHAARAESRTDGVDGAGAAVDRFERLEHLVRELVLRHETLRADHEALRERLEERESRVRELDDELLRLGQGRADAVKRIDALVAQIERLEATFEPQAAAE